MYIYIFFFLCRCGPTQLMASSLLRLLDHTQRRTTVCRTPVSTDQPDAEPCTWRYTTLTRDRHSCRRRDSNPQFQQASGRRPAPYALHV